MEKVWFDKYPNEVAREIGFGSYNSIIDVFDEAIGKFGDSQSYENMGVSMSFKELDHLSNQFASFLQNVAGIEKGDRVAIQMPNLLQYPVAIFGILKAGGIIVNTNPLYTAREMEHQFKDSGAKAILIVANFAHTLESILDKTSIKTVIVTELADLFPTPKRQIVNFVVKNVKKMIPSYNLPHFRFREALSLGADKTFERRAGGLDDIAFLQYTGGTTGVSKGAILTHKNILANMLQIVEWMKPSLREGKEIVITALPLYHIFSLTVNCLTFMKYGGKNVLITNPRDIPAFIKELKKSKLTVMTGVNTLFNALMNNPSFKEIDFSTLKLSVAGATALQKAVATKWKEMTGTDVVEGYGLTEASPVVCCNPIGGGDRVGTIGLPVPSTEVSLRDSENNEVPIGEAGELCVKGPQVMQGYWEKPEENKNVFTEDGWLKTGDVAVVSEDGFFQIVDRKKDMILVSGFNVYPNEIEDVCASHAKVLEVAAVGVPDEKSGEVVKVVVVKKDQTLTDSELIEFCRTTLVAYKVPKKVEFRDELPKTNVGKILRRALRDSIGAPVQH